MANFAQIQIKFTDFSDINASFGVQFVNTDRSIDVTYIWTCKSLRTGDFQYTQGSDIIEQTDNLFNAINADIANSSISAFMVVGGIDDDTVTIEANEFPWTIENTFVSGNVNAGFTEVPEVEPTKDFQLTGYSLGQAVSACADIEVTLTQNGDGVAPFTWISPANASTTLVADLSRPASAGTISITIEDDEGDQATIDDVLLPGAFNSTLIDDISIVANPGAQDSTVTVFMSNPQGLNDYTFSLDGSDFQTSNVFNGVLDGSYTLYVNDGFGCIATQGFDVVASENIEARTPNFSVPTANSVRMIQVTQSQFQTLDNTLYENESYFNEEKKRYFQPYQTNDGSITTQFSTNYAGISVKLLDCKGNTISTLDADQKSDNLDSQDKRDCIAYNRGNNQTGVYFTTGNIYDPGTTDIIDTYILDGQLPEWAVQGNTIELTGQITGSFRIKQTGRDEAVNAFVIVIDNVWTSGNQSESEIVEITYDKLPYETWEFDVDMGSFAQDVYKTQLTLTDEDQGFDAVVFLSESFQLKTTHKGTIFIEASDSSGTGIDYSTGYEVRVRLKGLTPGQDPTFGGSVDTYADSGENLKKVDDNPTRGGLAYFHLQPRYMLEKLRLTFSHDDYSINGEDFQNDDEYELLDYNKTSLRNSQIQVRKVGYQAFKNDNIDIDGQTGAILTEDSGKILQEKE